MGAEETGNDIDTVASSPQSTRGAQHLDFGFRIEPVAGLDFDRGHAFGAQP